MPKRKTAKLAVPKTEVEVNQYITALADAQTTAQRAAARANDRVQRIKAELAAELDTQTAQVAAYATALFAYFEKHRDELTDEGQRQSRVFATGILGQRWTPPRTQIKNEAAVERYVVDHRLTEFYEEKIVLRRDVMLANQDRAKVIPGVSFVRDRVVYVKPDVFDVEIVLKKKVEVAA